MDSTEKLIGEILFAWLHVICSPLLLLGPLHPGTPGTRSIRCGRSDAGTHGRARTWMLRAQSPRSSLLTCATRLKPPLGDRMSYVLFTGAIKNCAVRQTMPRKSWPCAMAGAGEA